MSDKTSEVPAHDAVPCCALATIELRWGQYSSLRCVGGLLTSFLMY